MTGPPDLGGRVGMVTGASRGIGRSIAVGMAATGMDVVGIARSRSDLDMVGDAVEAAGARFMPIAADVADVDAAPEHARLAWEWQGRVDGLVNAAGITDRADALVVTPKTWDRLFAVNVRGWFLPDPRRRRPDARGRWRFNREHRFGVRRCQRRRAGPRIAPPRVPSST